MTAFNGGIPAFNGKIAYGCKLEILIPCNAITVCSINDELTVTNQRIDSVVSQLQSISSAHLYNKPYIDDSFNSFNNNNNNNNNNGYYENEFILWSFIDKFTFLFLINIFTIIIGLFICYKGGLFSKNKIIKYSKIKNNNLSSEEEHMVN